MTIKVYYSFQEVCNLLDKTRSQVSYLISNGRINPANPNTWRGDGGYRFEKKEINDYLEEVKSKEKPLLTLSEAAKYLGRSKSFIQQAVNKGILPFEEIRNKKRNTKLYNRKELDKIKQNLSDNVRKSTGIPVCLNNLVLFDLQEIENQQFRIIDVEKRIGITDSGDYIEIPMHIQSKDISNKSYSTVPGSVIFIFPYHESYRSNILDTIFYLIKYVGSSNIKLWHLEEELKIQVRLVSIPYDYNIFRILMTFITEGEVLHKDKNITFTIGKMNLHIRVPVSIMEKIEKDKETMFLKSKSEVVEHIITKHYQSKTNNNY
ncbi:helix-turn-helix domain-containing protein [Bacillus manliponensis]|uniref:helix-turn-helix domain-containing protein n=1 Tax=Bacillus manliponensis TaxID=574376 RepID=UPI0030845B62